MVLFRRNWTMLLFCPTIAVLLALGIAGCLAPPNTRRVVLTSDRMPALRAAVEGHWAASSAQGAWKACAAYGPPIETGRIADRGLKEISGLAVSRKNPGVLWVHNDSGDGPFLYALSTAGALLGRLELKGARAVDWEDLALGPCDAGDCLYVGDIGDNKAMRKSVAVYRLVEPAVQAATPFGEMVVDSVTRFDLVYPKGPRNAESLAVHPNGTVYLLTKKRSTTATLFAFSTAASDRPIRLQPVGNVKIAQGLSRKITGMDIHPDGRRLLLRTYSNVLERRLEPGDAFTQIAQSPERLVPSATEPKGEAVGYDPVHGGYYQISEGTRPTVYCVGCATKTDPGQRP